MKSLFFPLAIGSRCWIVIFCSVQKRIRTLITSNCNEEMASKNKVSKIKEKEKNSGFDPHRIDLGEPQAKIIAELEVGTSIASD